MNIRFRRILITFTFSMLSLGVFWTGFQSAYAEPGNPPSPVPTRDWQDPPPTVFPPTQASQGAQIYYYYCMTCHGDRGQGLTQDWLDKIGMPENYCWSSKCHANNHVEGSFVFPHNVPAVIGPGVLSPFGTALRLHDFIKANKPYQTPGSMTDEEYWDLTAYLLSSNGFTSLPAVLDATSAVKIALQPTPTPTPFATWLGNAGWPYAIFGAALLIAAVAFLIARARLTRIG
jgi:hypothetical protein